MIYSATQVVEIMRDRMRSDARVIGWMSEVNARYNGTYILPWDRDLAESHSRVYSQMPNFSPAIVSEIIDGLAQRAGSVEWVLRCPAIDDTKETGVKSREYASIRRQALDYTWWMSMGDLLRRRLYKHLAAYATYCMIVKPDFEKKVPNIRLIDPLQAYPDRNGADILTPPTDIGFVTLYSASQVRARWPNTKEENGGAVPASGAYGESSEWYVVEWWDNVRTQWILLGPRLNPAAGGRDHIFEQGYDMELSPPFQNPLGYVPVICPERPTLDRISSNLQHILGMNDLMAKFQQLEMMAAEKAIFPDTYIISSMQNAARLEDGEWHDGRTGLINYITGSDGVGVLRTDSSPQSQLAIDRLERNMRVSTGLAAPMSGETFSTVRTGRAVDQALQAAVDPRIAEMQSVVSTWTPLINKAVMETYKAFWPGRDYECFSGNRGATSMIRFKPDKHFETAENSVLYPIPGADANSIVIALGQLKGMGAVSTHMVQMLHPYVDNPEAEQRRIDEEDTESMMKQAMAQRAALPPEAGGFGPLEIAIIYEEVSNRKPEESYAAAVLRAQQKIQELQATAAPEPQPGQVAAPETQPGLDGAVAAPEPDRIPGATVDQYDLRNLVSALSARAA